MKKIRIYPYKGFSNSAKELKKSLSNEFNVLRIKENGSKYKQRSAHLVINWGNTKKPQWLNGSMLNNYLSVYKAVNKIETFKALRDYNIPTVEWTEDINIANEWFNNGEVVVERHIVNGSQGKGIRIIENTGDEEILPAQLYTKHIRKAREYRVHIFNGKVIDIQQKKRRRIEDEEVQDGLIKNLANGWVFCRDGITLPPQNIYSVAIDSIKALGLDFGAVDILSKGDNVYVLEINTACGLQGTTLLNYVNAIKEYATRN